MPQTVTVAVDVIAWGVFHAATGYAAHHLGDERLSRDGFVLRPRGFERDGRFYRRRLRIHRWKDRLPEAGALFTGGVSKRQLPSADVAGLELFVRETRRAELGTLVGDGVQPPLRPLEPARACSPPDGVRGAREPPLHPHPALQPLPHPGDPPAAGAQREAVVSTEAQERRGLQAGPADASEPASGSRHGPIAQLLISWSPLSAILVAYAVAAWVSAPLETGDGATTNRVGAPLHVSGPAVADERAVRRRAHRVAPGAAADRLAAVVRRGRGAGLRHPLRHDPAADDARLVPAARPASPPGWWRCCRCRSSG